MAEAQVQRLAVSAGLLVAGLALGLAMNAGVGIAGLLVGAAAIALAQAIEVPAPSGDKLYLGLGAAVAVPLMVDGVTTTAAIYAMGLAGSWLVFAAKTGSRRTLGIRFLSECTALAAYGFAYYGTVAGFEASLVRGSGVELAAVAAGGLAWFVTRALIKALVGLERDDLSARYLWLLALEDWGVVLSVLAAGALFGLTFSEMRWWAFPVALLPYAFSHLAFVRYDGTRVTYRQTIRALARIPEVAGMAPDGHANRAADLALGMARDLGLHPDDVEELEYAALMHDIGRVTLNEPAILRAGYTDEDIARWGSQIIAEAPHLTRVADLVREQHRPYRVPGVDRDPTVPLAAKIIKVASAYDKAVCELRLFPVEALEHIHRGSAYDFDPIVAASLRRVLTHRGIIRA